MIHSQQPEILASETPAILTTWAAPTVEVLDVENLTEMDPFVGADAFLSAS
jgi:hypothetical protein